MKSTFSNLVTLSLFAISLGDVEKREADLIKDWKKNCIWLDEWQKKKFATGNERRKKVTIMNVFTNKGLAATEAPFVAENMLLALKMAINDINSFKNAFPLFFLTTESFARDNLTEIEIISELLLDLDSTRNGVFLIDAAGSNFVLLMKMVLTNFKVFQLSALSGQLAFPYTPKMEPRDDASVRVLVKLLKSFNWTTVSIVSQDGRDYRVLTDKALDTLINANISIAVRQVLTKRTKEVLLYMLQKGSRVILGFFDERTARNVFCAAYQVGLYGDRITWVVTNTHYRSNWWTLSDPTVSCSQNQMNIVVEGLFEPKIATLDSEVGLSGETPLQFWLRYSKNLKTVDYGDYRAAQVYDSVWAVALTLNKTFGSRFYQPTSQNPQLNDLKSEKLEIASTMQSLKFMGMRGPVAFDNSGYPYVLVYVNQIQYGTMRSVKLFTPTVELDILSLSPIMWPKNRTKRDQINKRVQPDKISDTVYITMCFFAAMAIAFAIYLLVFNIINKEDRVIKMSSPRLNIIIIIGCILVLSCVFIKAVGAEHGTTGCISYLLILNMGVSLTVSSLLVKTWRVYVIFKDIKVHQQSLNDIYMLAIVGFSSGLVFVIVVLWIIFNPITLKIIQEGCSWVKDEKMDEMVGSCEHQCQSPNNEVYRYLLLGVMTAVLALGVFLAWETRTVHIRELNESKALGLSIYTLVVFISLYVMITYSIVNNVNILYGLLSALLIVGPTSILCFILTPKLPICRRKTFLSAVKPMKPSFGGNTSPLGKSRTLSSST